MAMLNIPRAAWASGESCNLLADKEFREEDKANVKDDGTMFAHDEEGDRSMLLVEIVLM